MHHRSSGWMGFLFVWALAFPARGQVRVDTWPVVSMDIIGTDAKGNPLTSLTAESLVVRENEKPVKAVTLERVTGPMSICVLVDMSGSMFDRLPVLRASVQHFFETLPKEDEVCVLDFATKIYMPLKFTLDRSQAIATLAPLHPYGGTALHDALVLAVAYMRKNASEKNQAIVLFSDGDDNKSTLPAEQFLRDILMPGTPPVYVMRLPIVDDNHAGEKAARDLSQRTGGVAFFPHKDRDVLASVDHLNVVLNNTYVLMYQSEDGQKDGMERRVDVKLDNEHQKQKAAIHAPRGYTAPSQ